METLKTVVLSNTAIACGVTVGQVQHAYSRALIRKGGCMLVLDGDLSPAVCTAVAQSHFRDYYSRVTLTINHNLGVIVYELEV